MDNWLTAKSLILLFLIVSCGTVPKIKKWNEFITPTKNMAHSYGSYSAGCLDGGISLAYSGPGYQAVRITRRRFYGHPDLINFIQRIGKKVFQQRIGVLLIGDMSMPRGGVIDGEHGSHQNGLDVDIWFKYLQPSEIEDFTLHDGETINASSVLTDDFKEVSYEYWHKNHMRILNMISQDKKVDRVFVHPIIKKELCKFHKGNVWMSKVRPWWGHHRHFHVRLKCPSDSEHCSAQKTVPISDGCDDTLSWWFTEEARKMREQQEVIKQKRKEELVLPSQCESVRKYNYWIN